MGRPLGRPPLGDKAMTGAERLRRWRELRRPPETTERRLRKENTALEREVGRLRRENERLNRSDEKLKREVVWLKEELSLARTSRLRDLLDPPISISKRDCRALQRCLHPDGNPSEKQKTEAFQVFSALKMNVTEP